VNMKKILTEQAHGSITSGGKSRHNSSPAKGISVLKEAQHDTSLDTHLDAIASLLRTAEGRSELRRINAALGIVVPNVEGW